jgi:hypothetical protein
MSIMDNLSDTLYVGVDESNHGRFPEYFVATFSQMKSDIAEGNFKKERENHLNLFRKISKRDYSFLLLEESFLGKRPKRNAGKFKMMDKIVSSLIFGADLSCYRKVEILIDGVFTENKSYYIRDAISERCSVDKSILTINSGANFDKKYFIVNLADEIAHYLFRHIPRIELDGNKHQRFLIY